MARRQLAAEILMARRQLAAGIPLTAGILMAAGHAIPS